MQKFVKEYVPYIVIIILVLVIKRYVVTPIRVNGPSMLPTLKDKDIMILNEVSYRTQGLKRFDIVVLDYKGEKLIKRVIGLPGEKIEYKDNKLYVNGKVVKEDFSHADTEDFDEIKVEKDRYFVLGDNRVNSTDSRIIGTVSIKDIRGTTKLTIFPFGRFGNKNWVTIKSYFFLL